MLLPYESVGDCAFRNCGTRAKCFPRVCGRCSVFPDSVIPALLTRLVASSCKASNKHLPFSLFRFLFVPYSILFSKFFLNPIIRFLSPISSTTTNTDLLNSKSHMTRPLKITAKNEHCRSQTRTVPNKGQFCFLLFRQFQLKRLQPQKGRVRFLNLLTAGRIFENMHLRFRLQPHLIFLDPSISAAWHPRSPRIALPPDPFTA